jgi:hypothetical protein
MGLEEILISQQESHKKGEEEDMGEEVGKRKIIFQHISISVMLLRFDLD